MNAVVRRRTTDSIPIVYVVMRRNVWSCVWMFGIYEQVKCFRCVKKECLNWTAGCSNWDVKDEQLRWRQTEFSVNVTRCIKWERLGNRMKENWCVWEYRVREKHNWNTCCRRFFKVSRSWIKTFSKGNNSPSFNYVPCDLILYNYNILKFLKFYWNKSSIKQNKITRWHWI